MFFGLAVFVAAKYVSALSWSATLTLAGYFVLRMLPIINNSLWSMDSIPIVPPFLPVLLTLALITNITTSIKV